MSGPFTTITVEQFQRMQTAIGAATLFREQWKKMLAHWPEGEKIMPESLFNEAINAEQILGAALAALLKP